MILSNTKTGDERMGNIGDEPREVEFEPMPLTEPVKEPAAPTPEPVEPVKVPA